MLLLTRWHCLATPARKSLFFIYVFILLTAAMSSTSLAQQADNFTVALIPDTQYYCDLTNGGTPQMYYDLTGWLDAQAEARNIQFAIHLGDLVNTPDVQSEWDVADAAQSTLEWSVPYSVLPGNHDLDSNDYYNQYFGPDRFAGQSFYGGHQGTTNNNNYCFFRGGGMDFMVLSLEYDPSYETIAWAAQVVEAHPNHHVIVASHEYLSMDGRRAIGDRIWHFLVKNHDNIFMVVSGHIIGWDHQTSTNNAGHEVIEILSDYQWEPDGLSQPPLGGDGWLNTMEFAPTEDKIYFKSYSPYLDEWRTTELHEYELNFAMPDYLPGDANRDGRVNAADASILAANWNATGADWNIGDFNGDGTVNASDIRMMASNWGDSVASVGSIGTSVDVVPEPLSGVLFLSLLFASLARRPRHHSPVGK